MNNLNGYLNNAHILKKSGDIIKYTGDLILREIKTGQKVAVIFPHRRPVYFIGKYLSDAHKTSTDRVDMFSIDDFIDKCYETAVPLPFPKISPTEASFMLFDLNKKEKTAIIKNAEKLDVFMPWGYKLFGDFEELFIELTDPASCDDLIEQKLNPEQNLLNFRDKFAKFSQMYKNFYEMLMEHRLTSRSYRYKFVSDIFANSGAEAKAVLPEKVILAGFYGITNAESVIFKNILKNKREDAVIVSKTGEKIGDFLKKLGLSNENNEMPEETDERAEFYFNNASSIHGEIMKLKQTIKDSKNKLSSKDLIVLSTEDYLFPLLHNVLNSLSKEDYNVSIGYSLTRTPLYALFDLMAALHSRKKGGKFYAKDYISLFLHPYVKNIRGDFGVVQTRTLFHSIESYIKKNNILFVSVKDLENIKPIAEAESGIKDYFAGLNKIFISDFENIGNIKYFIKKIIKIIDTISVNSTADKHPYGLKFIESALTGLIEFEGIDFSDAEGTFNENAAAGLNMSLYKFDEISGYFNLLKNILKQQKVPFAGTPLKGLQVLGSLEAKILNFERVFYLGANEGIAPDVSIENTILTEDVRKFLNIPGARESARLQEYNFFNLISGAKEVHFFYNDSSSSEKSRFIEKIIWDIQKKSKNLKEPEEANSVFKINFIQKEPCKIEKPEEVKEYLCNMNYSPVKLDAYLKCPSMFYYRYVLSLRESEEVVGDMDAMGIGNVIHGVLKEYFGKFLNKSYLISNLEDEITVIHRILDKNFNGYGGYGSKLLNLQKKQIESALDAFIKTRRKDLYGATVIGVEYQLEADITLECYDKCDKKIKLTGRADLILEKDGKHCIIDYKTGSTLRGPYKNFIPTAGNRQEWPKRIESFQLPFYIILYDYSNGVVSYSDIEAKLWGLKKDGEYLINLKDNKSFDSYVGAVKGLIKEIIDSDYFDFVPKEKGGDKKICGYCPYSTLCGRI